MIPIVKMVMILVMMMVNVRREGSADSIRDSRHQHCNSCHLQLLPQTIHSPCFSFYISRFYFLYFYISAFEYFSSHLQWKTSIATAYKQSTRYYFPEFLVKFLYSSFSVFLHLSICIFLLPYSAAATDNHSLHIFLHHYTKKYQY